MLPRRHLPATPTHPTSDRRGWLYNAHRPAYDDHLAGCPNADTLGALVSGALSEAARADVANHAASCDGCHALLEGLLDGAHEATLGHDATTSEVLELRPGVRIGRYVIEERLGAGGMGVVYAAVDSELQRRVAVKLLRPDQDGELGSQGRERLLREARTLARLSHPNVVTVFDVGTHSGHLFLAMELVDGGSLSAWLREPRDPDEIIDRLIEAGRGLAAAHSAGVVHRDVKPDNILVGLDGRARMTDFGLARQDAARSDDEVDDVVSHDVAAGLTRTGTLMGTPIYMAPEQLLRGETTMQTDQWSFCATLYEALAGVRPFALDDLETRTAAIDQGRLVSPLPGRRVPAWVRRIVLRGLRADPSARWPSMAAVVTALARRHRRRRYVAISTVGALAIAGVAIAVSITGREPPALEVRTEPGWVDPRPGCSCPYSACKDGCRSVCRAPDYVLGAKPPGINNPQGQDALLGVASDGDSILYLTGPGCDINRLMLARRRGSTFVPIDLTSQIDRTRAAIFEGCCTISADGQTLVLATSARNGFVKARVVGDQLLPLEDAGVGDLMPRSTGKIRLEHPVLAADGLTFYYRLHEEGSGPGEVGPHDGIYVVERPDLRAPFAPPRRMSGRIRKYDYITGVSSDGLSLFTASEFETYVLVRASTREPFGDPDVGIMPRRMVGWRAAPLGDCSRIVTTSTPGGCASEDIAYLDAVGPSH